jgi:hypothetical protein
MNSTTPHPDRWFGPCPRTIEDDIFESIESRIRREAFEELAKNNTKKLTPVVKTEQQIDVDTISNFDYEGIVVKYKDNSEYQILWGMVEGRCIFALIAKPFELSDGIVKLAERKVGAQLSDYLSYLIDLGYSVYIES